MLTDVAGRIRNVHLPTSKPLLPLFEAINNSIQAIEDAGENNGRIEIEVIRSEDALFAASKSASDRQLTDINEFIIRDNGIGFSDANYDAFQTADTTSKANRGGKGIGRFMWLVAFESAEIESVFQNGKQANLRKFTFCPRGSGIEKPSVTEAPGRERETIVRLVGFKDKLQKLCPKRLETIAAYIVEEFLDVFLGPSCPKITLYDNIGSQKIDLDKFYDSEMVANSDRKECMIKSESFDVLHIRLYSTHINEHRMYLCANDRVVTRERLTGIPNLIRRLEDNDGKEFVYAVYVNSKALDTNVNSDRTGFNFSEESNGLLTDEISLSDIKKGILSSCTDYLEPFTRPVATKKQEMINRFIENDGAMYRPILKHLKGSFDKIAPDATADEIDRELYDAYHELQVSLRKEGSELLNNALTNSSDFTSFKDKFDEYFEKISEVNRADLARYVCHRKAIIEFLKQQLSLQSDGQYSLEDRIHSIIFPKGKTSDDILFNEHNLWLIDERLAFHVFLSSDQPINRAAPLQNASKKEPDILAFDKAVAFSETLEVPFNSITIIEFKRPQRKEYSEKENPFTQIANYITDIKAGKAKLADGRSLPISQNLPFYCYIICDITPKLKDWAHHFELQETPDGLGYFGYKRHYGAYCEVISYSKLASDAEKRNKAFFEKLGLPNRIV